MARLAMVTGASSGIGEAFAERLARGRLGSRARRAPPRPARGGRGPAVRRARRLGARPRADLADAAQLASLCSEAAELPLGMLVNNAALAHYMPFAELPAERGERARAAQRRWRPCCSRARRSAACCARDEGAVINVASLLAFSGAWDKPYLPKRAVYAASKSFLVTFTQILAGELRDSGVRVQVVCPGLVRSEFHSRQGLDMSEVPRMEPDSVVQGSLADLARGVVVSIPGAEDDAMLARARGRRGGAAALDALGRPARPVSLGRRVNGST